MLAKRTLDVVVAAVVLVLCSPVLISLYILIRIQMGAPVFFVQERPGLFGRPFKMMKFRSMTSAIDSNGTLLDDEARLTSLGKFLRRTSLDELPALFNVLKGDMSLVGPRPLLMRYLPLYSPEQSKRHNVLPGITGWAQVNGRNSIEWEKKFELDVWYVNNRNLFLDFKILFLTILKVMKREGISAVDSATMPEFKGSSDQQT